MRYTGLAATFQRLAYPDLDVVLYDYYGFNCSSAIQDTAALGAAFKDLTMPAMARDFIALKRSLVGTHKAFIMGGSHGAMLGAQIVGDYPADVERAVLFSGDTESGWLDDGWFRFDRLMTKLDAAHPGFLNELNRLLESADTGKLHIQKNGKDVVVDRAILESALWLAFSLNSEAQAALPALVKVAEEPAGLKALGKIYEGALALLEPLHPEQPPTEASLVTNFHRCNVWFPKSSRGAKTAGQGAVFHHEAFVRYWNTLCERYDALGEFPLRVAATTDVPILSWVGDQDTFDPEATRARWSRLSTQSSFHVMEGWSHDFGPAPGTGIERAAELVKAFLAASVDPLVQPPRR
jgi:pimeloyl-ACP methyl ester carboxylesterase